jgi:2-amino-4-hydroxy-6-hydroxymethyldihydropteridine diphosphokinase
MSLTPAPPATHLVFLGLGSNIEDKREHLQQARAFLESASVHTGRASSIYRTSPVDHLEQDWFLNQVLAVETTLSAPALLSHCQSVEQKMGRVRTIDKGPRLIDIDILFYESEIIQLPDLSVPHPRAAQRKFVLVPLAEIAPEFMHPLHRKSVRQLLAERDSDPAEVLLWSGSAPENAVA